MTEEKCAWKKDCLSLATQRLARDRKDQPPDDDMRVYTSDGKCIEVPARDNLEYIHVCDDHVEEARLFWQMALEDIPEQLS